MRVLAGLLLVLLLVPLVGSPPLRAEGEDRIAWFSDPATAYEHAKRIGRPVWVALHARDPKGARAWPHDLGAWNRLYRDPEVVAASRAFVCVLRLKWRPSERLLTKSPAHVIIGRDGQVVLQRSGWAAQAGAPSQQALLALLAKGRAAFGRISEETPTLTPDMLGAHAARLDAAAPAALGVQAAGFRAHLRWALPAPQVAGGEGASSVQAPITMTWDEEQDDTRYPMGRVRMIPGQVLNEAVDVRFDDHAGLRERVTVGQHLARFYVAPRRDGQPLTAAPVPVGFALIEVGEGGGGGGGSASDEPQPKPQEEDESNAPEPQAEGATPPPPPPPDKERFEVVEPFLRNDETIDKREAVVAVEDEDAGVEPPERRPLRKALPELQRALEHAVQEENYSPRDRAFLRRYFEALEALLRGKDGR